MGKFGRKLLVGLTALALLAAPAYSQMKGKGGKRSEPDQKSAQEKKKKDAVAEKAYKAAIDKLPDKPYDPWHSMR
jgi:hypothetical protein